MFHRAEKDFYAKIGHRSDGIIGNFLMRQGTESSRCNTFSVGCRATDRRSSDRPFNRPADQRNPTDKYHGIRSKNCVGLCRLNLTQLTNTMILIRILSDATYNFEIRFVAMINY